MPFFQTPNNWSLHYELHGDGPEKVLLVMGFACCKSYWNPLVDRLLEWGARDWNGTVAAAAAGTGSGESGAQHPPRHHRPSQRGPSSTGVPGGASSAETATVAPSPARSKSRYTVCCFDSRGFGLSGDSLARYSSSSMARDMAALLMHLGWVHPSRSELALDLSKHRTRERAHAALEQAEKEGRWAEAWQAPPLHICGWSMGGFCATELALHLGEWGLAQTAVRPPSAPPVLDFRSCVITSSSRGGFTHGGESFDAEPIQREEEEESDPAAAAFASAATAAAAAAASSSVSRAYRFLSLSSLQRLLRLRGAAAAVGRWGWGRTWLLRNLPPPAGLYRIFRLVFLSLYHSRIERVLELHYSPHFLAQPFKGDMRAALAGEDAASAGSGSNGGGGGGGGGATHSAGSSLLPPSSALLHLPQSSAALTSSAKSAIEIRRDELSGDFLWSQQPDHDEGGSFDADNEPEQHGQERGEEAASTVAHGRGEQGPNDSLVPGPAQTSSDETGALATAAAAAAAAEAEEQEEEAEQVALLSHAPRITSLHMTPAQKRRVLAREAESRSEDTTTHADVDAGEGQDGQRTSRRVQPDSYAAAAASGGALSPVDWTPGSNAFNTSILAPPSPAALATTLPRPVRSRSGSISGGGGGGQQRVLTNRDVLSSQYLSRAPFDRYIVQYAWALFGHGLVCLTHHVSRARIRAFLAGQRRALLQGSALRHSLRWLVITGSADILVHPGNSFHLSEQLQCPLYVLENVGHMVHVEQPDAFAQLLHAHFTRQPVQHLQAYVHGGHSIIATPLGPSRKISAAGDGAGAEAGTGAPNAPQTDCGMRGMTVTLMDDGGGGGEGGGNDGGGGSDEDRGEGGDGFLSASERAALAARGGGLSRRNSFLVQIEGEAQSSSGAGAGAPGSSDNWLRSPPAHGRSPSFSAASSSSPGSWAPASAASSSSSSSSSSLLRAPSFSSSAGHSRRHSLVELRREQTLRRQAGCCARLIARLTSIPLHSVALAGEALRAAPALAVDAVTRPWRLLRLPSRILGALSRRLGGTVVRHLPPTPRPAHRTLGASHSGEANHLEPPPALARITTT